LNLPISETSITISCLEALSTIGDKQGLDVIDSLPYQQSSQVRLEIVKAVEKLGMGSRRSAVRILEPFLSDSETEVSEAARRALAKLVPSKRVKGLILKHDISGESLLNRTRHYFMLITGLRVIDAFARAWWSFYSPIMREEQARGAEALIQVPGQNTLTVEFSAYLEPMKKYAQFSADMVAERSRGIHRWVNNVLVIWLPLFLISLGLYFLVRIPIKFTQSYPPLFAWFLLTLSVILIVTAYTRQTARTWFIPMFWGGIIGISIYARILPFLFSHLDWWIPVGLAVIYALIFGLFLLIVL
jgi:hypothetical protein